MGFNRADPVADRAGSRLEYQKPLTTREFDEGGHVGAIGIDDRASGDLGDAARAVLRSGIDDDDIDDVAADGMGHQRRQHAGQRILVIAGRNQHREHRSRLSHVAAQRKIPHECSCLVLFRALGK